MLEEGVILLLPMVLVHEIDETVVEQFDVIGVVHVVETIQFRRADAVRERM